MPPLPGDLPWTTPAYLLIDGVSAPYLVTHLRNWGNPAYCLYSNTRWHELADISPCLISVPTADDPLLLHFLENATHEWGYLLFSHATKQSLCDHWRNLLTVEDPGGVQVMPRIADPAVMHPLFSLAEQASSGRWFGPVSHVCLPDAMQGMWLRHQCPADVRTHPLKRYRFTEQEFTALGEVEFRRSVLNLTRHMQAAFPGYAASGTARQRLQLIDQIARQAYDLGFTCEQQMTLYANVQGYLAGQAMTDHPDISDLLTNPSSGTHLSRVLRAAKLAEDRATPQQGRPS